MEGTEKDIEFGENQASAEAASQSPRATLQDRPTVTKWGTVSNTNHSNEDRRGNDTREETTPRSPLGRATKPSKETMDE